MPRQARVTTVIFLPSETVVQVSQKDGSLLESALNAGLELDHSCGGQGTCGTCRIFVEQGLESLLPRNEIEKEMADDREFSAEERLSCQIKPSQPLVVRVPHKTD